jgi:hypothetical protein
LLSRGVLKGVTRSKDQPIINLVFQQEHPK